MVRILTYKLEFYMKDIENVTFQGIIRNFIISISTCFVLFIPSKNTFALEHLIPNISFSFQLKIRLHASTINFPFYVLDRFLLFMFRTATSTRRAENAPKTHTSSVRNAQQRTGIGQQREENALRKIINICDD